LWGRRSPIPRSASGQPITNSYSKKIYLEQFNTITINTTKNQVSNTVSCDSLVCVGYDLYLNGISVHSGTSYIVGSLDPLTITYNPHKQFSGYISYIELNSYKDDISNYAKAMFDIHSNITWVLPSYETENNNAKSENLQIFKHKRTLFINNLNHTKDDIIIPITLLGSGYNLTNNSTYNNNALRTHNDQISNSIFDFKKINLNNIDLAFTLLGDVNMLEWTSDEYDVVNDKITIWVKIPKYNGQRLVMYYNSQRIETEKIKRNPFSHLYGGWTMDKIVNTYGYRFEKQDLFNAGENIIYLKHGDSKYLLQINYQYMYLIY
jgi:hypothetical protein